jgi:FkbM family methyltransferase
VDLFAEGAYPCEGLSGVRTIIDAGANVGLASLFFLRAFPEARVIAIESDPVNLAAAETNLKPYASQVTLLHAALWPTEGRLTVRTGSFRDGRAWASQVAPSAMGEVEAVTIPFLMARYGIDTIDLLKIDIEGAEVPLLEGDTSYLAHVRTLMIELHEREYPQCSALFDAAIRPHGFSVTRHNVTMIAARDRV